MPARLAAGIAGAAAFAVGLGGIRLVADFLHDGALPAIPVVEVEIQAEAMATLAGVVPSRRHGRVLKRLRTPGATVLAGDPILEFEDLALRASKAELDGEIAALRALAVEMAATRGLATGADSAEIRLAALRSLEESYESARKDLQRWRTLHADGLVARLDYERKEREFADVEARLRAARSSVAEGGPTTARPREEPAIGKVRRAERLRQRLDRLSGTFSVRSPWDGRIRGFHVQEGDTPRRGSPLATIERDARPILATDVTDLGAGPVVSVRSACGVPGPFPFTIRDGTLRLIAPTVSMQPGDRCRVVVQTRAGN